MNPADTNTIHAETVGGVDVLRIGNSTDGPTLIIFHGYGADNNDLAPLRDLLPSDSTTRWYFPNGPLQVPISPFYSGRAWFPIDVAAIERAMRNGRPRDMTDAEPAGLASSRKLVQEMIQNLNIPWSRLILGGFSQGAMLATDLALHAPENPAGLVILSGTLLNADQWRRLAPQRAGLRFFQSHGTHDVLLPFNAATALYDVLTAAGLRGVWTEFGGGHEIPRQVSYNLSQFLATCVAEIGSST